MLAYHPKLVCVYSYFRNYALIRGLCIPTINLLAYLLRLHDIVRTRLRRYRVYTYGMYYLQVASCKLQVATYELEKHRPGE